MVMEENKTRQVNEDEKKPLTLLEQLSKVKDPRGAQGRIYNFSEMVCIAVIAVLCGVDSWVGVTEFAKAQIDWFKKYFKLESGIPSHDAFNDLFEKIDSKEFAKAFSLWAQELSEVTNQIIAIDGKQIRGSKKSKTKLAALHCVNAFVTSNKIVLGQVKTEDKSNEITAIPELLNTLALEGAIVTIDAMGCQTKIAKTIREKGADYVLSVKENQKNTLEEIEYFFKEAEKEEFEGIELYREEAEKPSRNRIEKRVVEAVSSDHCLYLGEKWYDIKSVMRVTRYRRIKGKESKEIAYYISSLQADRPELLKAPRAHWGVENNLHWILDVAYKEDACKLRKGYGGENFSVLRKGTLNMILQDKSKKAGVSMKRCIAAWNIPYREKLLQLSSPSVF